jgi:hypothetical protein
VGPPFSATLSYDAAQTGTARPDRRGGQRPDLMPEASNNPVTGNYEKWFDVSAFGRPVPGYLGNLGRNTIRGPNYTNVDFTLIKQIDLRKWGENRRVDLRFEFFNILNHTNFDLPAVARMQVFSASSVNEDAGRITSAARSREIQVNQTVPVCARISLVPAAGPNPVSARRPHRRLSAVFLPVMFCQAAPVLVCCVRSIDA